MTWAMCCRVPSVARVRGRAIDRAVARVASHYPRVAKSNAWDVMYPAFIEDPDLFAPDLFHASAEGHLVFASAGRPVSDRLVQIWQDYTDNTAEIRTDPDDA